MYALEMKAISGANTENLGKRWTPMQRFSNRKEAVKTLLEFLLRDEKERRLGDFTYRIKKIKPEDATI